MPRAISPTKTSLITSLIKEGLSSRQVAVKAGVSHFTVNKIRQKMPDSPPVPKSGQPRKLSPRERRVLVRLICNNKAQTAVEATKEINRTRSDPVSADTVRAALKEANLVAMKKGKTSHV